MKKLLEVKNLGISFKTMSGIVQPIHDISFEIGTSETVGIVGESGCGKSITAFSIIGLLGKNALINPNSSILLTGDNICTYSEKKMAEIRGSRISMIFQEPMTSLNPVFSIGWQLSEVYKLHTKLTNKQIYDKSLHMMNLVGIKNPQITVKNFPHHLSGGMRQRVMIAIALACNPQLLLADEPTSALDVTIQAQIIRLMQELQKEFSTAIIMITHDLGLVAQMCDRVIVMYAGSIVEQASVYELFDRPLHPYTQALLGSRPAIDRKKSEQKKLYTIQGTVPHPSNYPKGCKFWPRCEKKMQKCITHHPSVYSLSADHSTSCWLYALPPEPNSTCQENFQTN